MWKFDIHEMCTFSGGKIIQNFNFSFPLIDLGRVRLIAQLGNEGRNQRSVAEYLILTTVAAIYRL